MLVADGPGPNSVGSCMHHPCGADSAVSHQCLPAGVAGAGAFCTDPPEGHQAKAVSSAPSQSPGKRKRLTRKQAAGFGSSEARGICGDVQVLAGPSEEGRCRFAVPGEGTYTAGATAKLSYRWGPATR